MSSGSKQQSHDLHTAPKKKKKKHIPSRPTKEMNYNVDSNYADMNARQDAFLLKFKAVEDPDGSKKAALIKQFQHCVTVNNQYQEMIKELHKRLKRAEDMNKEHRESIEEYIEEMKRQPKKKLSRMRPVNMFSAPYFYDPKRRSSPKNDDAILKEENCDVDAYLHMPKSWKPLHFKLLENGIKSNVVTLIEKPKKIRRDMLKNKLKQNMFPLGEEAQAIQEIADIEEEIKRLADGPSNEEMTKYRDQIDWMYVSVTHLLGLRTARECECVWRNYLDPAIYKGKFTEEEDQKLLKTATCYEFRDWDAIAKDMETNRTAIQCFQRYQRKLNKNILKKYWTKEEDEKLLEAVKMYKIRDYIPWHKVVFRMEGRTRIQVTNRWIRTVDPMTTRASWTVAEDTMLCLGVRKYGFQWNKIKDFLPGRSNYLCRERYSNTLSPNLKIGSWTAEEDKKLVSAVRQYGYGKWSKISENFENRTDNMCLQRAQCLKLFKSKQKGPKSKETDGEWSKTTKKRTKYCEKLNQRLIDARKAVEETAAPLLRKVLRRDDIESLDTVNFDTVNLKTLLKIKEELKLTPESVRPSDWKPNYTMFEKSQRAASENDVESIAADDDEEEDDEYDDDDMDCDDSDDGLDPETRQEEEDFYDDFLFKMCGLRAILDMKHMDHTKGIMLTHKEATETAVYENYIFEAFQCNEKVNYNERNPDEMTFSGVNYTVSIPRTLCLFVIPPVSQSMFHVFPANSFNLRCYEVMNTLRWLLIQSASFVEYSKPFLMSLEPSNPDPQTVNCGYCRRNDIRVEDPNENEILKVRKSFITIGENLERWIADELDEKNVGQCTCALENRNTQRIMLFFKRIVAILLWPWIAKEQGLNLQQQQMLFSNIKNDLRLTPSTNGRKRKKPSISKSKAIKKDDDDEYECPGSIEKLDVPKSKKTRASDENKDNENVAPNSISQPLRRSLRSHTLKRRDL